ncbi:serine hydrolase domain-containing protein [Aquisalimonas sp.]|uniref:serine hydrolase domain-containing protein n=1 Tax=Aquisalimonas sp. TaxID=1872621 RepID=UPI0025C2D1FA|nr:serine hydrolase domain-containing protein [Aquisalimonas sp.]
MTIQVAIDRMDRDDVPGMVIVLLRAGEPVATAALGLADRTTGRAMTEDALFRTESISKPVTAWGAMRLAQTGRLDLDAPITACLTRWQPSETTPDITVRQLLSHTAGIGQGDFAARYAPAALRPGLTEHLAGDFRMIATPGTAFAYSNTGYNLLELVIEDCTGEDFGAFMAREVLRPLGMSSASYDWTDAVMAMGHDLHGLPVTPYVYPGRGSGGLFATAGDVARFAAASLSGADQRVLAPASVAALHSPRNEVSGLFGYAAGGYGLGHFTETLSDGRTAVWHGGQGYGWMSHMHLVPETGDGIIILSNSQRAWPVFAAILRDWSGSLGVAPVGMARVLWAETAARTAIVLALVGATLTFWIAHLGRPRPRVVRVGAGGIAVALIVWPLWAAAQDYLFLFSILPGVWPWLGAASAVAGLGLGTMALVPVRRR